MTIRYVLRKRVSRIIDVKHNSFSFAKVTGVERRAFLEEAFGGLREGRQEFTRSVAFGRML